MIILATVLAHLFYSAECCSDKDCHPVPCDQVKDLGSGWEWNGKKFDHAQLRVSPDGYCHVCIATTAPRCIYLPPSS
jgi:hypothetical protein